MEARDYVKELVARSRAAQSEFEKNFTQEQVDEVVRIIGKTVFDNAEPLARLARDESRMGVYEDKIAKNKGKSRIIWNSLKGKKSVGILSSDPVSGITEIARPIGVVAAVTPCTNPIVTPMCNAMFALKCHNSVIIAPHPRSKKCLKLLMELWDKALAPLNVPKDLIIGIEEPSIEMTGVLMQEADVTIATGGMGMVKSAYSSGKPAFGVGAGNVQCIIDRGMNISEVVPKIIAGRIFDNGIICSGEQTIIAPKDEYDAIIKEAVKNGAFYVDNKDEVAKFRAAIFPNGVMNKDLVGQSIAKVAEAAGVAIPEGTKAVILKADDCGRKDLLAKEKMCPVIAAYAYDKFEDGVAIACANLDYEGKGHSVSIHSNDRKHLEYAGLTIPVSRVLVNQICSTMNGGAFSNSLTPTTTLGCGSWGNNSISENLAYKFLMNVTRVATVKQNPVQPSDEEIWG